MASSVAPLNVFTGSSQFANDLQNVIARSVSLASQPLQQLQTQQATFTSQLNAAQSLENVISSLNSSVQSVGSSTSNPISTSISNTSVLSANATSSALPGSYIVNVSNAGSFSTAKSSDGLPSVSDPTSQNISSSSTYTLTVGTNTVNLKLSSNNLNALAAAINSSGAGVQATIINVGSSTPDYRLALQATNLGNQSIQLNDGTSNLLTSLSTGTNAVYTVNGLPSGGISTTTQNVTIAPGLTATLNATGTSTINVSNSSSSITNSLQGLVNAYNSAVAELAKSHGQNAGPLAGDSTISVVTQALQNLVTYTGGSGSIHSLADLGVQFTKQGTLTFDSTALNSFTPGQISDALSFLGTSSSGFLQSATNTLNGLLDPSSGVITNDINGYSQNITDINNRITTQQNQITLLQTNLTNQMAAADAMLSTLESQNSFLTQLFQTTNANNNAGV